MHIFGGMLLTVNNGVEMIFHLSHLVYQITFWQNLLLPPLVIKQTWRDRLEKDILVVMLCLENGC